jgi:hypothetical protein
VTGRANILHGGPKERLNNKLPWSFDMTLTQKDKLLRCALTAFGVVFCLIYPVGMIWPSGWVWHGGHGQYYLQMICGVYAVLGIFLIAAGRDPYSNRSLISFTIWSSLVHAVIMAAHAIYDGHELGHLTGDVPALLLVAACFGSCLLQASSGKAAYPSAHIRLHSRLSEDRVSRRFG